MNIIKNLAKRGGYLLGAVLASMIVGTILLLIVYSLPTNRIKANLEGAVSILQKEGDGYYWAPWIGSSHLDNFTDAIMLNEAAYRSGNVIQDAMDCPWMTADDLSENSDALAISLSGEEREGFGPEAYTVYWHGYLVWLKPLLMVSAFSDIRIIAMCIQFILSLYLMLELFKMGGYRYVVPWAVTILWLNPVSMSVSIQLGCIYIISLLAILVLIKKKLFNSENYYRLFVWIGISTAYFDFLTYPVAAFGLPLVFLIALGSFDFAKGFKTIITSGFSWALSYGFMWAGKWLVSDLLTDSTTIADGINQVLYRTAGKAEDASQNLSYSFFDVLEYNTLDVKTRGVQLVVFMLVVLLIYLIFIKKYHIKVDWTKAGLLAISAMMPFVWFFVVRNHSVLHSWMTYRNLAVSLLAVMFMFSDSIKKDTV